MSSAKSIMFQGTASHVGKSVLVAALCRILREDGYRVAPFKAQNMALNSFVTKDGGEIGRAQAFQAEAARIEPTIDTNPILLKPTSDTGAQVIIHGRVYGNMMAREYHDFKETAIGYVLESYNRLAKEYDVIVIEGAGSPAEINLRENDIANMGLAEEVDAPVILIGDIDRGGVFASLIGTLELLNANERERIKGFIINKFRGDLNLLEPGLRFLENSTGKPVLGVIPYLKDIYLPEEDGVSLEVRSPQSAVGKETICIAVIKLPHISNFTDFDPFRAEPCVEFRYVIKPSDLDEADTVIIPGSKNTISDLLYLKEKGIYNAILDHHNRGGEVVGICGGYQMLGIEVRDPYGVETDKGSINGLGLLPVTTVLEKGKVTSQAEAVYLPDASVPPVKGYEIHMGRTELFHGAMPIFRIISRSGVKTDIPDGAKSNDGRVWGTYIHGLFDNDGFRHYFIERLRMKKGLIRPRSNTCFAKLKDDSCKRLTEVVRAALDIPRLYKIIAL